MIIFYANLNKESMQIRTNLLLHQYTFIQNNIKLIFIDIDEENDSYYFIEHKGLGINSTTLPYIIWRSNLEWKGDSFYHKSYLTKYIYGTDIIPKLAIGYSLKNIREINDLFDFLTNYDDFAKDTRLKNN